MQTDHRDICVSIVNYKTADLVVEALPALLEELAACRHSLVTIVDNASPGDDAEKLESYVASHGLGQRVRVVRSDANGGFSWGNNIAFDTARLLPWKPDAVLLLNPDAVIRPRAIAAMTEILHRNPRAGVVGGRLENDDGTVWTAAFNFPSAIREFVNQLAVGMISRHWPVQIETEDRPSRADWVTGALMMIRWDVIEQMRGMDERYFLYFEEVDFMNRAGKLGWEIWHAPDAVALHLPGSSTGIVDGQPRTGRMPTYWFESWKRYYAQNHGPYYTRFAATLRTVGMTLGILQRKIRGREALVPLHFYFDFIKHCLFGSLRDARQPPRVDDHRGLVESGVWSQEQFDSLTRDIV